VHVGVHDVRARRAGLLACRVAEQTKHHLAAQQRAGAIQLLALKNILFQYQSARFGHVGDIE
jgi:hypothetical protein